MPVPPATTTTPVATPNAPGTRPPYQGQSTNTSANPNPQMQLVGSDAVVFTGQGNPTLPTQITVTFPNLPVRTVKNNPLTPLNSTKNPLHVTPQGSLLLHVHVMGTPGAPGTVITVAPQAITKDNAVVPGPFLGAEGYLAFQAVVTISNSPITQTIRGSVGAHLMMALA